MLIFLPARPRTLPCLWLLFISCALCVGALGGESDGENLDTAPAVQPDPAERIKGEVYATILREDERGFTRLASPQKGEWLSIHTEAPQTLGLYRAQPQVRPTAERTRIVLQPLGAMTDENKKLVEILRVYCEAFFQIPTRVAEPLEIAAKGVVFDRPVPMGNRHGSYDRQFDGDLILDELMLKKLPDDAIAYFGVTLQDLFSGDLNYVFGLGSLRERVGVYSLCRYFPEFWGRKRVAGDETLGLRRACKVLSHEIGHVFSLSHCVFYRCNMNGSNSLQETDGEPVEFCPVCHRKLLWNLGFDPLKRFQALQQFYHKHGLQEEAEWMAKRIENWKKVVLREEKLPEE